MNITKTARDQHRRRRQIEKRANELQDEMDKLQSRWEKLGDQIGEDRLAELNEENGLSRSYEFRDALA